MTSKFWVLVPIGIILLLAGYEYRYRPIYVFIPKDVQVTIPEGTNIADMDAILAEAEVISQGTFLDARYLALEGELFPDTYRFDRDSSAQDVIVRMKKTYDDRRTLIIASILEKEVQTPGDMRLVAGIIENLLNAGMALQVDATVRYGICLSLWRSGTYCDVTQVNLVDNLKRDTAYNTYTRTGLPAGPISNPGIAVLQAALNPQPSEYWYYLSAKDGTTIFSKTLQEHNQAKARYLR